MPISSSTTTFNQIWLEGQFVSDFADLDGCRCTEKTLAFISCLLLLIIGKTEADHDLLTNTS